MLSGTSRATLLISKLVVKTQSCRGHAATKLLPKEIRTDEDMDMRGSCNQTGSKIKLKYELYFLKDSMQAKNIQPSMVVIELTEAPLRLTSAKSNVLVF